MTDKWAEALEYVAADLGRDAAEFSGQGAPRLAKRLVGHAAALRSLRAALLDLTSDGWWAKECTEQLEQQPGRMSLAGIVRKRLEEASE